MVMANIMFSAPYRDVKVRWSSLRCYASTGRSSHRPSHSSFAALCYLLCQRAAADGRLGDLNPTPWAFMFFNCLGWVTYAILINNLFVFFGNIFALVLSVWLNMIALELQYADFHVTEIRRSIVIALQDTSQQGMTHDILDPSTPLDYARIVWNVAAQNTKAPIAHKTIIMFLTVIWTALLCIICLARSLSPYTKSFIIGVAVNIVLVFFYGAPLSTIFTVIKTRSCSTIHPPTMYTTFLNGLFWAAFGFAVTDWFIAVPNLLGAVLGAIQMILCAVYPRASAEKEIIKASVAEDTGTDPMIEMCSDKSNKDDEEQGKKDDTA
jgi:solute carrier family 50 protein (sugar transporter)